MIKYKLTTQDMKTRKGEYNEVTWKIGEWQKELSGKGELCGEGFYHYYHHPLLAAMMNPAHADIDNPRIWKVEAVGKHLDDNGVKGGCTKMRIMVEVELPQVNRVQRVAFAILCAKEVYKDKEWNKWADDWLSGKDRSASYASYASSASYASYASYASSASSYAASAASYAAYAAEWDYKKLLFIAKKAMKYT